LLKNRKNEITKMLICNFCNYKFRKMGVHDYICFFHNDGQCLELHEDCCGRLDKLVDEDDDSEEYHDESSCGSGYAYLVFFDIKKDTTDALVALKEYQKGQASNISVKKIPYSWDSWDFGVDKKYWESFGYNNVFEIRCEDEDVYTSVWKLTIKDTLKTYGRKKECWMINICPTCYKNFTDKPRDPTKMCAKYITNMAERFKYENPTSKSEVYNKIREDTKWLRESLPYHLDKDGFVEIVKK
jgi:hypothetical protein